ncbi:FAD-dependent oxygenase [Streptomyces dioscori]|uniref:FAD-dependent oxygenase n=1 Tax=Streptomyces dioscori TaxID=2109333 RepID=A0A2P8Q9N7_9ACTN|nr:FAD-binding oxidoreductase [Streptomyces dioscori]PSM42955.1 FAD-dependent oxygenase [Streptomyces dioscori]
MSDGKSPAPVRPQDIADLAREIEGPVLVPGADGYADECAAYNLNSRLHPAVVVGASTEKDVSAAVRFAARHGLPIAVRSGAHQVVQPAHGALLVTTQRMRDITVDPQARTVRAQAGLRWSDVLPHTTQHGLAPVVGSAPDVSVVGYTLGGGQSPLLGRTRGYASDQVRRIDIVTADGELVVATSENEPDLFWAVLGGKGNFGIVTEIEFDVFPLTRFYGGGIYFAGEHLAEVLDAWRTWLPTIPDDMTSSIGVQRLPDLPALPGPLRGAFVVHLRIGYLGSAAEGEELIAPLRAAAPALLDLVGEKPFSAVGEIHLDPVDPMPYFDRTVCLREFTRETADALVRLTGADSGCTLANVEIRALGGALDDAPAVPNSVPTRGVPFVVFAFAVGGADRAESLRADLAEVMDGLAPWSVQRRMVNFLSPDEATTEQEMRSAYGDERYTRLTRVKQRHDPSNVFRLNHNVRPSGR